VHARHSGGFIVELTYGTRQFSGSQLTVIEAPAANPAPTREPDCDDRPGPTPEVETATALVRLEQEEMTRLERVWIAGRLEILARCRQFDRIPLFH